jgi:hypothetical protein
MAEPWEDQGPLGFPPLSLTKTPTHCFIPNSTLQHGLHRAFPEEGFGSGRKVSEQEVHDAVTKIVIAKYCTYYMTEVPCGRPQSPGDSNAFKEALRGRVDLEVILALADQAISKFQASSLLRTMVRKHLCIVEHSALCKLK